MGRWPRRQEIDTLRTCGSKRFSDRALPNTHGGALKYGRMSPNTAQSLHSRRKCINRIFVNLN